MKPAPPKLMGLRAYARHRAERGVGGMTHTAVRKAIESGRLSDSLVPTRRGRFLIDQDKADVEWEFETDPAQQREPETAPAKPATGAELRQLTIDGGHEPVVRPEATNSPGMAADGGQVPRSGFARERERVTAAKAELAELELAERRGAMISRVKVQDEYYRQGKKLREAIMSIPQQHSDRLANLRDPKKHQKQLADLLREALRSLDTRDSADRS